jgi:hypothetical protein
LRGYENPYVSLASAYLSTSEGHLLEAWFNAEMAEYLFHEKHKLCVDATFREFSISVKAEIVNRLHSESSESAWLKLVPIIKHLSRNNLREFDEYYCAIRTFDITEDFIFGGC